MTDIYLSSFYRKDFTERSVREIHERTEPGSFQLHIFDNDSDRETQDFLYGLLKDGKIASLHLDSRNTGCQYNKGVYHMMTEHTSPYYVVTDNDIYPPKLTPDWLSQMLRIMDNHPELALLTPQLPPQRFQMPDLTNIPDDIVYCKAVGNTFKMIRRKTFPVESFFPKIGTYGDDGLLSHMVREEGWKVAFCRHIFCYHAGQCDNWGYKPEEITRDPRKKEYGKPFVYPIVDEEKYLPSEYMRI